MTRDGRPPQVELGDGLPSRGCCLTVLVACAVFWGGLAYLLYRALA